MLQVGQNGQNGQDYHDVGCLGAGRSLFIHEIIQKMVRSIYILERVVTEKMRSACQKVQCFWLQDMSIALHQLQSGSHILEK